MARLNSVMFLASFVASRNVDIFPESSIASNCSLYAGACFSMECMVALKASSSLSGMFIALKSALTFVRCCCGDSPCAIPCVARDARTISLDLSILIN